MLINVHPLNYRHLKYHILLDISRLILTECWYFRGDTFNYSKSLVTIICISNLHRERIIKQLIYIYVNVKTMYMLLNKLFGVWHIDDNTVAYCKILVVW